MNRLKIGIIGCGKQASKHGASLKKMGNIEIVVADIDPQQARKFAEQENCDYAADANDIFMNQAVCAVIICTPTQSHVELITKALKYGKSVFCEKPLAESEEEIVELRQLAKEANQVLMIGYIYRFVPVFEECHRLFREQAVDGESMIMGRPLSAFFRLGGRGSHQAWKHRKDLGGGAINEMLVHMLDLANWFFGPLDNLKVITNRLLLEEREIQGVKVQADAEDFIMVQCTGAGDVQIFCQADLITPDFCQYAEIQCENGTFRGSIQQDQPSYVFLKNSRGGYASGKTELSFGTRSLLDIQMTSFVLAVQKKSGPDRNTLEDSHHLMKIVQQLKQQITE